MEPGYSSDDDVPPLYCEALVHRPKQCLIMLEMLIFSRGGLAVHPSIIGFSNGVHPHLDGERYCCDVAVSLARSNNILLYYDFERFVVEFLKKHGYFIGGFKSLVEVIKRLQEHEFFKTFNECPDIDSAAVHRVEVTERFVRLLLLRHGFLWSSITYHMNHVTVLMTLNLD